MNEDRPTCHYFSDGYCVLHGKDCTDVTPEECRTEQREISKGQQFIEIAAVLIILAGIFALSILMRR